MSASLLYKVSAVLLILFALGHTMGFRKVDPTWNADGVVSGMRSVSFDVQGFRRSYWDFFAGFGFSSLAGSDDWDDCGFAPLPGTALAATFVNS